jgi:alanine racemase
MGHAHGLGVEQSRTCHSIDAIGSVNMNMMTIDITDINTAKRQDEVIKLDPKRHDCFSCFF